jgi:hypothetical protein
MTKSKVLSCYLPGETEEKPYNISPRIVVVLTEIYPPPTEYKQECSQPNLLTDLSMKVYFSHRFPSILHGKDKSCNILPQ